MGCGASSAPKTEDEPPVRASESIDHAATRVSVSKSADAKPLEETVDEKDDGSDDSDRSPPPSPVRFSKASSDAVDGVLPSPRGTSSMPDATREKLTKIYDAIDTTDSHDRGITIYEFRAATASLNMLYLFGSFEDDEEIWCGDESVRATLDRWLSGMWAYGQDMGEENFEAGLDALVEATGRLHDASTSLPPERLKLLKKVFKEAPMLRRASRRAVLCAQSSSLRAVFDRLLTRLDPVCFFIDAPAVWAPFASLCWYVFWVLGSKNLIKPIKKLVFRSPMLPKPGFYCVF